MFFPLYDLNRAVRPPLVTLSLIALNLVVFLWFQANPPQARFERTLQLGFIPARFTLLGKGQPVVIETPRLARVRYLPIVVQVKQQYVIPTTWRAVLTSLVSCMFLHGSWSHILGNMWFLWIFGNNVEDRLGHYKYLIFYLLGGALASLCHWWTEPQSTVPVIGASGAVATVLGAYAVTFPHARIRTLVFLLVFVTLLDVPALLVLGVWFLGQLAEAQRALGIVQMSGGVAWWAHVGGFVAGAILMPLWSEPPPPQAANDEPEPPDEGMTGGQATNWP